MSMDTTRNRKRHNNNKMFWIVAAALATACVTEAEEAAAHQPAADGGEVPCHEERPRADFAPSTARTHDGMLRTGQGYGLRIDRLTLDADTARLQGAGVRDADLRALYGKRLRLDGVKIEGRVFDLEGQAGRLPHDGLGIRGDIPLDVIVRQEIEPGSGHRDNQRATLAFDFEVPDQFLDGIDFAQLAPQIPPRPEDHPPQQQPSAATT